VARYEDMLRPIADGQPLPEIVMPKEYLPGRKDMPRTPPVSVTGPVPITPPRVSMPHEELELSEKATPSTPGGAPGLIQFVPVPLPVPTTNSAPAPPPAAAKP